MTRQTKRITKDDLGRLVETARTSSRGRTNHNLHPALADPIQRLCNAIEPGSYVRPHHHPQEGRWELFVALTGTACALIFDPETGRVLERVEFGADGPTAVVEIRPGAVHTVAALSPGTVLFEVKPGPYIAEEDKCFAPWAPAEDDPTAPRFEAWFRRASIDDTPPLNPDPEAAI